MKAAARYAPWVPRKIAEAAGTVVGPIALASDLSENGVKWLVGLKFSSQTKHAGITSAVAHFISGSNPLRSMAIYVQWEWQEGTKTFLLILHFDAGFSKRIKNLRAEHRAFWERKYGYGENYDENEMVSFSPAVIDHVSQLPTGVMNKLGDFSKIKYRNVITWSPSHLEIGVVGELLCHANIINGYKEERRKRLRTHLEFWTDEEEIQRWLEKYKHLEGTGIHPPEVPDSISKEVEAVNLLRETLVNKTILAVERGKQGGSALCAELCPEYIDYLKLVLEKSL